MKAVFCLLFFLPQLLSAQANPNFNVSLQLDFSSAQAMIDMCEGMANNVSRVAALKGNAIAAATSILLSRKQVPPDAFIHKLELLRDNFRDTDDVFGLEETREHLADIKALLAETQRHAVDRRVLATIEQFFPENIGVTAAIPVYVVAMGNERAAAFVRRVRWNGTSPEFVGENEGEPVVVVNLARLVEYPHDVQEQFISLLSVLAHESFHAIFSTFQQTSPVWRQWHQRRDPFAVLAELVQNEGIAYYISMQQQMNANPPQQWYDIAAHSIVALNEALLQLQSPDLTQVQARNLIMNANLSGSMQKNYGATAGNLMALEIDMKLGRPALTETIVKGPEDFFEKYETLQQQYGDVPKISAEIMKGFER
ncbi:MAG: hypothetical protein KGJ59_03085 [Bacteroidota bacterium]|nr:hypothetical protein [Bacteroidota bacterium]